MSRSLSGRRSPAYRHLPVPRVRQHLPDGISGLEPQKVRGACVQSPPVTSRLRAWFWDSRVAQMRLLVFGVVLAATVVKLILAATTQGTNDVFNWAQFAQGVRQYGPIDIYGHRFLVGTHLFPVYNHPPLMGWMLVLFNKLDDLGIPFRFMIRVPATLADIVTTLLVFELVRSRRSLLEATIAGVTVAASPALIIV